VNRKNRLKRNLGGEVDAGIEPFFDGPALAEVRTSVVLAERLILLVLRSEVERLAADPDELTRFFRHFFDPTATAAQREQFVAHFTKSPPTTVLGYPRSAAEFPCLAVTLDSEEETEPGVLGNYIGETLEGELGEDAEYEGAYFQQSYGVTVYAENPDVCAYLYQFAKLTLFGAREALENAGVLELKYSGGELGPEDHLPENMFARSLHVQCKVLMTVPRLFAHRDARRLRITGIFRDDVVVDGVQGGVSSCVATEDDDE